jgi:hypothetical protein
VDAPQKVCTGKFVRMKFLYYAHYRINYVALKISDDALNKLKAPVTIMFFELLLYYELLFWAAIVTGAEWIGHNKLFYIIPSCIILIFNAATFDFNRNFKNELKEASHYPKEKKRKWDIYIVSIMVFILVSFFFSAHELRVFYPLPLKK